MSAYADTSVPVERSKEQIRSLFRKHGVTGFNIGEEWSTHTIVLEFVRPEIVRASTEAKGIEVNLGIRMMVKVAEGRRQHGDYTAAAWERRERQVWRALYWHLKSELEAVEFGLRSMTDAFLAHIVMQNGRTLGEGFREGLRDGRLALPEAVQR